MKILPINFVRQRVFLNLNRLLKRQKKGSENEDDTVVEQMNPEHYIVAVTGCPTGIAHTYMAAEALEKKAKELGYLIKVETRGAGGAKNVLTADEIERCRWYYRSGRHAGADGSFSGKTNRCY